MAQVVDSNPAIQIYFSSPFQISLDSPHRKCAVWVEASSYKAKHDRGVFLLMRRTIFLLCTASIIS